MRFTKEKELRDAYFNNTTKRKTKYLWYPITIDGETRWLETATIDYTVKKLVGGFDVYFSWEPYCFINK
jgi:hypothetical protein